jgi:hypothetical protein
MNKCVSKIVDININDSIFDDIVDCTYVVLCCGEFPKRLENVNKNIEILRPTKTVKLVYNNGFDNCYLSYTVNQDLINIQSFIFEDALERGYKRILYLEDDFELKKEISKSDIYNIGKFFKSNDPDVYGIGNIGMCDIRSIFKPHEKTMFNFLGLTHAIFYNKKYMKNYLEYIKKIDTKNYMIDTITTKIPDIETYRYYKPLVYQKFPSTENQKNGWSNGFGKFLASINIFFIKFLKLDNQLEPGYTIIYVFPYILYMLIFILFIFLIYKLLRKIS